MLMIKKLINKLLGKPNAISFKQTFDLTNLPIVTFKQGDKKFNFILDTGASDNIIDSNILPQIDHRLLNLESDIYGMEGHKSVVKLCSIVLSCNNTNFEYNYLICDMSDAFGYIKKSSGVNVHGILGSKFFNKFQYILDFKDLTAYCKK